MTTLCSHSALLPDFTADPSAKTRLFRGLAESSRLAILETLRTGERSVSELVEATGLTQPNVSNHLACLLGCGLVHREQRGRHVIYSLSDARVDVLLGMVEDLLRDLADAITSCPHCAAREAE